MFKSELDRSTIIRCAWGVLCALAAGSTLAHAHVSIRALKTPPARLGPEPAAFFSGAVGLQNASYFYGESVRGRSSFTGVRVEGVFRSDGPIFETQGSGEGLVLFESLTNSRFGFFEAPELYVGTSTQLSSAIQGYIGRKQTEWSALDRHWGMGITAPRFRWDYVRPANVALTGFTAAARTKWASIEGFFSPLFIPDRGVPIDVQDGKLVSDTRFFLPPIRELRLNGIRPPTRYSLQNPSVRDVIFRRSWGGQLTVGKSSGFYAAASYLNKPMNQVAVAVDGYFALPDGRVNIDVYTRFLRHEVTSLDVGHRSVRTDVVASVMQDSPERVSSPATWTAQRFSQSTAWGLTATHRLGEARYQPAQVDLSVLRQVGGNLSDQGPYTRPGQSYFEQRYPFQNAIQFGVDTPLVPFRLAGAQSGLRGGMRYLYDWAQNGNMFSTVLTYRSATHWTASLGADFITALAGVNPSGLFGRYRINDRVFGGVSYVF